MNSKFFAEDVGISLEIIGRDNLVINPECSKVEFRLRLIDPKKRSSKHKENEAIQFDFDMNVDDCDETCSEMCRANIINEEDLRNVANLMKIQIANLKRDRRDKQAQENVSPPAPIAENIITNNQLPQQQIVTNNQLVQQSIQDIQGTQPNQIVLPNQAMIPMQSTENKSNDISDVHATFANSAPIKTSLIPNTMQPILNVQNGASITPLPMPIASTIATQINTISLIPSTASVSTPTMVTSNMTPSLEAPILQPGIIDPIQSDVTVNVQNITTPSQNTICNTNQLQPNSALPSPVGLIKDSNAVSTPPASSTTNQASSSANVISKRRTNKSTERCPKLVVLSITNNTLVECQMQNKQKTITFKFDIDDVNLVEIANNLVNAIFNNSYYEVQHRT